ncbi:MAG: hypothetical protein BWK79_05920 [Beggiatoa sp. IS2]|nr:MAG: hypothetical protein BWK79_05920 [Beggiatoa sp. IS2]
MGISIGHLLVVLMITLVLFGTKKLKDVGSDLGGAIKSFRQAMRDGETTPETEEKADKTPRVSLAEKGEVIEGQVTNEQQSNKVDRNT